MTFKTAFKTRLTPAMAARWRGAGLWSDETLATVLARRVAETPDREALTDGTHRLSYREFRDFDHVAMAAELKPKLPALECIGVIRGAPLSGMVSLDEVAAGSGA